MFLLYPPRKKAKKSEKKAKRKRKKCEKNAKIKRKKVKKKRQIRAATFFCFFVCFAFCFFFALFLLYKTILAPCIYGWRARHKPSAEVKAVGLEVSPN